MAKNIHLQTVLNEPSEAAERLPFFHMLPKDKAGLIRWRIYVLKRCGVDSEFREHINQMCSKDVVFFAATFAWLHETRDDAFTETAGKFPFVPWTDQVDILAWLQEFGGQTDITIEKTRGIGLSWLITIFLIWKWLYHGEHLDYGIVSKDDTALDLPRRPASLMGKLDILFENLPGWMQLDENGKTILHRTHGFHRFINLLNNNAILGFTAKDDKLRGARVNLLIVDEAAYLPVDTQRWLATSQFISSSRILVSTHDGTATMFYRLTINTKKRLTRLTTWWQANPARWAGAYVVKGGMVHYLDEKYKHSPDYEFHFEHPGLPRSPWVDSEFEKPEVDVTRLMQEIYGTAAIDTKKLFQRTTLDIAERSSTTPSYRCRLTAHDEFLEDLEGDWYFWKDPSLPFGSRYVIGVDPAIGVMGKALAAVVAMDIKTGCTVASAALAACTPVELARAVVTLCKMLCGPRGDGYATVAYESTGIGVSFLTELRRLRWPSIHKENKKFGIPNKDKGEKLLIETGRAIADGDFVITDTRIVDDFDHFEYNAKYDLVFTGDVGHGDLGQAAALAWWAGRIHRRTVLEAENPPIDANKQPIELEPMFVKRKNWVRVWSNRFSMRQ